MFEFRIAHNLLFSFPLQIMMSLKSLPPVVQVHILDKYLDKCFKDEQKQKLNVVFKNLNALVLLSNSVRSHSEEVRPLVLPSCNRPLRYLIEQIERDSRFMWPRTKILEWLETPSGHQCVWDARICPSTTYQQPLNAVSTDFYIRKYKINHRHARLDLLFGTSSDLGDILAVQPFEPNGQPTHKHKEVMGNISVFLKLTEHSQTVPKYDIYDRDALRFLGGHEVLRNVFGDDFWDLLGEPYRSTGICQADPTKLILRYMSFV